MVFDKLNVKGNWEENDWHGVKKVDWFQSSGEMDVILIEVGTKATGMVEFTKEKKNEKNVVGKP